MPHTVHASPRILDSTRGARRQSERGGLWGGAFFSVLPPTRIRLIEGVLNELSNEGYFTATFGVRCRLGKAKKRGRGGEHRGLGSALVHASRELVGRLSVLAASRRQTDVGR